MTDPAAAQFADIQARPARAGDGHRVLAVALLVSLALHVFTFSQLSTRQAAGNPDLAPAAAAVIRLALAPPQADAEEPATPTQDSQPAPAAATETPLARQPASPPIPPRQSHEWQPLPGLLAELTPALMPRLPGRAEQQAQLTLADSVAVLPMAPRQQQLIAGKIEQWREQLPAVDEPLRWRSEQQEFEVSLQRLAPAGPTDLEKAILTVSTWIDGTELSTRLQLRRMAFSHFAQVVDRWNPDVSLSRDRIDGRFHSNSRLVVETGGDSAPRINGETTVTGGVSLNRPGRRAAVFAGGLQTRARRIVLPRQPGPWPAAETPATENVHRLAADTDLKFLADGSYRWHPTAEPSAVSRRRIPDQPYYIVADNKVQLRVSGVVDGAVLVYAPERIIISGSLHYAQDPEQHPESDDYLGLVSDKVVEIAEPAVTGNGDLSVYAAIYAKRRFVVRRFRTRSEALLTIYGSVTAGSLSATEPRFSTWLRFDPRLEHTRPPGFPMTNRYALDDWQPAWTVADVGPEGRGL